jgi:hypothetical protein
MSGARFLKGPKTPILTALPTGMGAADDGREIRFLADATNGIVWLLRYRHFQPDGVTVNPSAYKWEGVGEQQPLVSVIGPAQAVSPYVAAFTDLATLGPDVVPPLAGDYFVRGTVSVSHTAANANSYNIMDFAVGAAAAPQSGVNASGYFLGQYHGTAYTGNTYGTSRTVRKNGLVAGTVIRAKYMGYDSAAVANVSQFMERELALMPVRVG